MAPPPPLASRIALACAGLVFLLASAILAGWALDHEELKHAFMPGVAAMPDTALGLLLGAIAVAARIPRGLPQVAAGSGRWAKRVSLAATLGLILIGAMQGLEIAAAFIRGAEVFYFGILPEPPYQLPPSPQAGLALLLTGLALLLARSRWGYVGHAAEWVAFLIFLVGLIGISAYAFGAAEILHMRGFAAVPAAALIGSLALGTAIPLAIYDRRGLVGLLSAKNGGSVMLRKMLPAALAVTFCFGWIFVGGVNRGWFSAAAGGALLAGACFAILLLIMLRAAIGINRLEAEKEEIGESYQAIVDTAPGSVLVVDSAGIITMANSHAGQMFGYGHGELIGLSVDALVPDSLRAGHAALRASYHERPTQRRMGGGTGSALRVRRKDGSEFTASISLGPRQTCNGLMVTAIIHDVTDAVQREAEVQRVNRALRLLSAANQAMRGAASQIELLDEICNIIIHVGGYRFAWIGYPENDDKKTVTPVAFDGFEDGFLTEATMTWDGSPTGCGTAGTAIRSGQPVIVRNIAQEGRLGPWREMLLRRGYASVAAFPLRFDGRVGAAVIIYSSTENAFGPGECALLEDLAADIGYGIGALRASESRTQTEAALRRSESTLARAQEIAHIGSWEWDLETNAISWSAEAYRLFGFEAGEVVPDFSMVLARTHPDDRAALKEKTKTVRAGEVSAAVLDFRVVWEDGTTRSLHMQAEVEFHDTGPFRVVGVLQDISERKRFEEKLADLASHDALTGLPNRHLLNDRLEQSLAHTRYTNRILALVFVDLDRFKIINDTLGHDAGDQLLKEIAARLSSCLREGDTVARQGGDEFVVVLTDLAKAEDAAFVAQKMLDSLAPPCHLCGHEVVPAASIGIALYPRDGGNIQELMMSADKAMYAAKQAGRGQYRFFDPEMNRAATDWLEVSSELHHALARNEFELHYQPKVNLRSGAITGVEALLRWRNPQLGLVPPNKFIPILEETGLILEVGEWVIARACRQARLWQEQGLPPLRIAVNLSPRQFQQRGLAERIRAIIDQPDFLPEYLELEITESMVTQNVERAIAMLQELRRIGVHLAIDDFGTGYSSLAVLKRFPVSCLKIDRSFVRDVPHDLDDVAITRAVILLAHSMGLSVVAEGVETEAQRAFLVDCGCDEMQGFLFSRPLPATELAERVLGHLATALAA
jgi:diguanylate cyclase (GGDEF)-like protein/PAS domain S-box-containing protein